MIQRWTYFFSTTSLQPVQIYLDSPLHPFFYMFVLLLFSMESVLHQKHHLHYHGLLMYDVHKTVPVHDAKMNILFSYITAASTDIPGFTLASFLSTCSFCFHFQWPVSCTRNVFTITERPLSFSHVFGD